MFNPSRFAKALMLSGFVGLVGCSQPSQNNNASTEKANSNEQKTSETTATTNKTIAITAIVEHPSLDAVRKGVIDELAEQGLKEGENLKVNFQSAQGNTGTAGQIAKQFVSDNPDVIVAISTPSAQSVVASTNSIPVVFSAVTDPVEAKLVSKLDGSGTNVTGASDAVPLDPQIKLMKEIFPNLKNVGYVYSPGEVNSTVVLKNLKDKLTPMGITVVEAPAQRSNDIAMAGRSLQGKVDMIYTTTDNNVVSAYEALYQASKEAKIPLISTAPTDAGRGAAAAMGVDYYDLGRNTGKIVYRILNGEKAGSIPVYTAEKLELHVSPKHAQEQGLTLPQSVIDQAKEVIK